MAVSWLSRSTAERTETAGLGRISPAESRLEREEALDTLVARCRAQRLSTLAAIGLWRNATVEQLVAITGNLGLARRRSAERSLAWSAGLVQRGTLVTGMPGKAQLQPRHLMYRPDNHGVIEELSRRLSYREWLGVTAGSVWEPGGQYDRHDLLTTEVSLRVAEWCGVATVLGEPLTAWQLMLGSSLDLPTGRRAADAAWVRPDGLTIAVEMTANVSQQFQAKARRWAEVLARDTTKSVMVLFIGAIHPDRSNGADVANRLRKAVTAAAHSSMDTVLAGVAERMAVVRWTDWFPEPGMVDPTMLGLAAQRPTGPEGKRWEPVNLLDPFDMVFTPAPGTNPTAVIDNANLLYGVPHWLKTGPGPDLFGLLRARAGLPAGKRSRAG